MGLKSNFKSDLQKEQILSALLDTYYQKHLKHYHFERIHDLKRQLRGIDLILTHKLNGKTFLVDEKAQLDYINDNLPTFAFELDYQKNGGTKPGWLFDVSKKTQFYALITAIYSDEPNKFTTCRITFVNRGKLIDFLKSRKIDRKQLESLLENTQNQNGKRVIKELNPKTEGYLFFSTRNKAEKPTNLILKLDFLEENGLAKRLV